MKNALVTGFAPLPTGQLEATFYLFIRCLSKRAVVVLGIIWILMYGFVSEVSAEPLIYRFGWTGSGSVTTTFTNAPFVATFVGDTTNVTGTSNTGYINEYLPGTLAGAFGETYALSDYWVGITPASNPGQSLLFGDSSSYAGILDMYAKDSALTAYDLMSSIGPINSDAVLKSGLSQTPYFDLASASNFWFEAVRPNSSSVPEPSTMLLLGSGVIGLVAYGRKKFFNKS